MLAKTSIGITITKSRACGDSKHSKITFYLTVMSKHTSMSLTVLLKMTLANAYRALEGAMSKLVNPLKM